LAIWRRLAEAASYTHAASSYTGVSAAVLDFAARHVAAQHFASSQDGPMHQSPQKQLPARREKYVEFDEGEADRRMYRGAQPKARKFSVREESQRELRRERQPSPK
jgi:hypothetical protein